MSLRLSLRLQRGDFRLHVDTTLASTGVTGIMGPSGCGKTTLLRALAGLECVRGAVIRFNEAVWQDAQKFVPTHQRRIGYVFQDAFLFPHLNVERNLRYGYVRAPVAQRQMDLDRVIALFDLQALLPRAVGTLSGGERQRVAMARALASSPQLLLLDEPLSALDAARRREILPFLARLRDELAIPMLYVSHARDEHAQLADQLLLLEAGEVVALDTIHAAFARTDLALVHDPEAGALVDAVAVHADPEFGLMRLQFPGGELQVAAEKLQIGQQVRLRIAARDISLTLQAQHGTSILNSFPVRIEQLVASGSAQMLVRIRTAEEIPLLSRITRKSAYELGLHEGQSLYAQVKSVALLG
jgi:molybdate transport system ATP-binding protein